MSERTNAPVWLRVTVVCVAIGLLSVNYAVRRAAADSERLEALCDATATATVERANAAVDRCEAMLEGIGRPLGWLGVACAERCKAQMDD